MRVEPANDAQGGADTKVAVEIEPARHHHVGFPVARLPRQVGVAEQDGRARRGAARRERPRAGSLLDGSAHGAPVEVEERRLRRAAQPANPSAGLARARTIDVQRRDVMPGERRRHPVGELFRVLRHVAVHTGGKPLVHGSGIPVEFDVGFHGAGEGGPIREVRVERAAPLVEGKFPACAKQSKRHALAIVLDLQVAQRVPERFQVVGVDVRHSVGSPYDLDLPGQFGIEFVLAVRRCRPDGRDAGDQCEREEAAPRAPAENRGRHNLHLPVRGDSTSAHERAAFLEPGP